MTAVCENLPRITIVTPSFNQVAFLEATIQSVLSQSYPDLEYIIIDGGSTDGSASIIQKYASQLAYWCSEPDGGQYAAINKGFQRSTGEVMAWLNSDDVFFPWTLNTVGTIMRDRKEVEWLSTLQPGRVDQEGVFGRFGCFEGFSHAAFLDGRYLQNGCSRPFGCIQQESTFWRRSLWSTSGGLNASRFDLAADFELWARFFRTSQLFGVISPLAGFRSHGNQRSRAIQKYEAQARIALDQARSDAKWGRRLVREACYTLKFHRIPGARSFQKKFLGYDSKRLVKREGRWETDDHVFI